MVATCLNFQRHVIKLGSVTFYKIKLPVELKGQFTAEDSHVLLMIPGGEDLNILTEKLLIECCKCKIILVHFSKPTSVNHGAALMYADNLKVMHSLKRITPENYVEMKNENGSLSLFP